LLFLLDANVLIDANRDYYALDRVPEFWRWLLQLARNGSVKMPLETFEELTAGQDRNDPLKAWAHRHRRALLLGEDVHEGILARVLEVYGPRLTEEEQRKMSRDPFLIAYALANPSSRTVVTTEVSRPSKRRANRHIPDVCRDLGVRCLNTFALVRELNFRTSEHQ